MISQSSAPGQRPELRPDSDSECSNANTLQDARLQKIWKFCGIFEEMEARAGIEPACKDLQSSA
jgi:hypothetical protein